MAAWVYFGVPHKTAQGEGIRVAGWGDHPPLLSFWPYCQLPGGPGAGLMSLSALGLPMRPAGRCHGFMLLCRVRAHAAGFLIAVQECGKPSKFRERLLYFYFIYLFILTWENTFYCTNVIRKENF